MGKLHTHYDNLKVARMAPQEVIRAAYKALSQKYHPDKNPGDEKAARIMAILNSAYGNLADPQRRREHDEWIAAEEWEIDWLESTRQEEERQRHDPALRRPEPESAAHAKRRGWTRGAALAVCLAVGWLGGVLTPASFSGWPSWDGRHELLASSGDSADAPAAEPRGNVIDSGVPSRPAAPPAPAPALAVRAYSQLPVTAAADCQGGAPSLFAPNGRAWPPASGYVEGFRVDNKGPDMQVEFDNGNDGSDVFVKVYDLKRRVNVRHLFVRAHDKLTIGQLALGAYEVRYQAVGPAGCGSQKDH